VALVQPAVAQAHEGRHRPAAASFADHRVVELTTEGSRGESLLALHQSRAHTVTATNTAMAITSCDGCRAVALSFQVVVADGGPATVDVGNLAVAMNEGCTGCESVAVAYQVVVVSSHNLILTRGGARQLTDLRQRLRLLARSDLPVTEVQTQADSLMAGMATLLATDLHVRARVRHDHDLVQGPATHHGHPALRGHRA
jgi:hypothetical protein